MNNDFSIKPCRGIIVLDACEIEYLATCSLDVTPCTPIAELEPKTGSYLDLLPLLAKQGFQIIIPEMVAMESAYISADGIRPNAYFSRNRKHYHYNQEREAVDFFTHVLSGRGPEYSNIEIRPAQHGEKKYQQYMQSMRQATKLKLCRDINIRDVKFAIGGVEKDFKISGDKKHLGEQHCFDVIEDELRKQQEGKPRIPIFFLSSDSGARSILRERVKKYHNVSVNLLSTPGIFSALEKDLTGPDGDEINALEILGFSGQGDKHWDRIREMKQNSPLKAYRDSLNGSHDSPVDSYKSGQFPFMKAVHGLAQELVAEFDRKEAAGKEHPKPPSQIMKFYNRYKQAPNGNEDKTRR